MLLQIFKSIAKLQTSKRLALNVEIKDICDLVKIDSVMSLIDLQVNVKNNVCSFCLLDVIEKE